MDISISKSSAAISCVCRSLGGDQLEANGNSYTKC